MKSLFIQHKPLIFSLLLWLALVIPGLGEYMRCNPHLLMGLVAMPLMLKGLRREQRSTRWLWLAPGLVALYVAGGPTVCLHMAAGLVLLGMIEIYFGRLAVYGVGLWAMLSPVPDAVIGPFTFDWRLKLSEWVGAAFRLTGANVQVEGTGFVVNGQAFSVEAACLGLSSVNTGLILLLALLAAQPRPLRVRHQAVLWATVPALLLVSNLFRIALIVFFQAPPGTALHEILGILTLVVYVVLPMGWMVRGFARVSVNSQGQLSDNPYPQPPSPRKGAFAPNGVWPLLLAFAALAFGLYRHQQHPVASLTPIPAIVAPGFAQTIVQEGIVKLERPGVLIYLKPGVAPWRSEHSPAVCWRGSGYEVQQQALRTLPNGLTVNAGTLQKGDTALHTLWWFANGVSATASPAEWRRRTLTGEPAFWLINVTATTPAAAAQAAEELMAQNRGLGQVSNMPKNR